MLGATRFASSRGKAINPLPGVNQYRPLWGRLFMIDYSKAVDEGVSFIADDNCSQLLVLIFVVSGWTLHEEILAMEHEAAELKACRKATPKHVAMADLPTEDQFKRLAVQSKHFIDTIKMIAYRAETAMAAIVREKMRRHDDARSLLRAVYATEADLIPDENAGILTVRLHQLANRMSGETLRHLCEELNATMTMFPGTSLRLVYKLVS